MKRDDVLEIMRSNRYLGVVPLPDLESVAHAFSLETYAAGHVYFRQGHRSVDLHLLVRGQVTARHKERLREHVVSQYGPGELFGLVGSIAGAPQSVTCTAAEECEVATLRRESLQLLRQQLAPIAFAFQKALFAQLARDLRRADERLRAILPRTSSGSI